jgi:hypothetical protein
MKRALLFATTLLVACSSGSSGSPAEGSDANDQDSAVTLDEGLPFDSTTPTDDTTATTDTTTGSDTPDEVALGPYPAGPYGNVVGATFPNLQWQGYVDDAADVIATSETFGDYSMDAVRRSGKAYAFVHVSEFY